MTVSLSVLGIYLVIGLFFIIFSKNISNFIYNLILMYMDRVNLKDVFLFKVDHSNRDSFFSLARWFVTFLGLFLVSFCAYFIWYWFSLF